MIAGFDVTDFKINLIFQFKPVFLFDEKIKIEIYLENEKNEKMK